MQVLRKIKRISIVSATFILALLGMSLLGLVTTGLGLRIVIVVGPIVCCVVSLTCYSVFGIDTGPFNFKTHQFLNLVITWPGIIAAMITYIASGFLMSEDCNRI